MIGQTYRYYGCPQDFVLKEILDWVYVFECGHRVMDSIFFEDMYPVNIQLKLL